MPPLVEEAATVGVWWVKCQLTDPAEFRVVVTRSWSRWSSGRCLAQKGHGGHRVLSFKACDAQNLRRHQ